MSESAETLAIRRAGRSIIASIAGSVFASLSDVLRWVYWWHSAEAVPGDVPAESVSYKVNSDFEASLLSATEIQCWWQPKAISRDTLLDNLRMGEIVPSERTNEQEVELIRSDTVAPLRSAGSKSLG